MSRYLVKEMTNNDLEMEKNGGLVKEYAFSRMKCLWFFWLEVSRLQPCTQKLFIITISISCLSCLLPTQQDTPIF